MIEPVVATIHEENCSGCRICNDLCPFNAIDYDIAKEKVSRVTETLCKGCGTCVAACPAQAITGAHFNNEQIMAEIEGSVVGRACAATNRRRPRSSPSRAERESASCRATTTTNELSNPRSSASSATGALTGLPTWPARRA